MSTINTCIKKRGRPKVESEAAQVRIQQPLLGALDRWADKGGISRPEAIRRLIQRGLEAEEQNRESS